MLDPRTLIAGSWKPGDGGCWDRLTALRVAWNALGYTGLPWMQKLQPYVKNMQIFRCPSGPSAIGYSMNNWAL